MQENMQITDPRRYTKEYPASNILIKQAMDLLNQCQSIKESADFESTIHHDDLVNTLHRLLKHENDALINVALNLSPSYAVSNLIWKSLNIAINNKEAVSIFALPMVLVIGSKTKTILNGQLNTDLLNEFFLKNNLVNSDYDFFVSGKLIDATAIAKIKPSQLYYWARNIKNANLWLPQNLEGSSIEALNEGVFLRFLVGVAINKNTQVDTSLDNNQKNNAHYNYGDTQMNFMNYESFRKSSINLMQLINQELHKNGVTLFTIPFPVVPLSDAFRVGDNHRKEIAISVAMSNAVREVRSLGSIPLVCIMTENNAIKLIVYSTDKYDHNDNGDDMQPLTNNPIETSMWQLNHLDDFEAILRTLTDLLGDMQVKWYYATT